MSMAAGTLSAGSASGSVASSPYRAPVQLPRSNSRKSPPLAFERTPNDALIPLISPSEKQDLDPFAARSPLATGDSSSATSFMQTVIDKQSTALHALHTAFAAERDAWACERRQLYQRVANLERLLRAQNGHSPAKSPIISPHGSVASPQSRAVTATTRLPSIAENDNIRPLSERRDNAPRSLSIPSIQNIEEQMERNVEDFNFPAAAQLDELGVSPPHSPVHLLPPANVTMAGHTPLKSAVRPPTPPPKDMALIGVEDTPTRNNTHLNALLTQSSDEEEDLALKGPLNMPELPSKPSANNFTEEMLFKRLEQIAQNPAENKPTIFSIPSPGLALAEEDGVDAGLSPQAGLVAASTEAPLAPVATRCEIDTQAVLSPVAHENDPPVSAIDHDHKFEQGGIRLKKKPSTNFGVPFGQLGGFGLRKLS